MPEIVPTLLLVAVPGYLVLALHRVYPARARATLIRAVALMAIYGALLTFGLASVGLTLLLRG